MALLVVFVVLLSFALNLSSGQKSDIAFPRDCIIDCSIVRQYCYVPDALLTKLTDLVAQSATKTTLIRAYQCCCKVGWCDLTPCLNGAKCVTNGTAEYCCCAQGYEGERCDTATEGCKVMKCAGGCEYTCSGATCVCHAGSTGDACDVDIRECDSRPCLNGGTCVEGEANMYQCKCAAGFAGTQCEQNIDECHSTPCTPVQTAQCVDGIDFFTCTCQPGFVGTRCEISVNACSSNPCVALQTTQCVDGVSRFTCECKAGFDGTRCETNIDECQSNPCVEAQRVRCVDGVNQFTCECVAGFTGPRCEVNTNECQSSPCVTAQSERCVDGINSYLCVCRTGFTGPRCEVNIDDCSPNPCVSSQTSQCVDGINRFRCDCKPGFTGDRCESDVCECQSSPCLNRGICTEPRPSFYACVCPSGWTGTLCELAAPCDSHPCLNGGTCADQGSGRFFCLCPVGIVGTVCDVMPCTTPSPVVPTTGSSAPTPCSSSPCKNGGSCSVIGSAFNCTCAKGYLGTDCGTDINECASHPCLQTQTCYDSSTSGTVGPDRYFCVAIPTTSPLPRDTSTGMNQVTDQTPVPTAHGTGEETTVSTSHSQGSSPLSSKAPAGSTYETPTITTDQTSVPSKCNPDLPLWIGCAAGGLLLIMVLITIGSLCYARGMTQKLRASATAQANQTAKTSSLDSIENKSSGEYMKVNDYYDSTSPELATLTVTDHEAKVPLDGSN